MCTDKYFIDLSVSSHTLKDKQLLTAYASSQAILKQKYSEVCSCSNATTLINGVVAHYGVLSVSCFHLNSITTVSSRKPLLTNCWPL